MCSHYSGNLGQDTAILSPLSGEEDENMMGIPVHESFTTFFIKIS